LGRPLAYEYAGFFHDGRSYPVWTDDEDPDRHYVLPPSLEVATDSHGPKISVAVCEAISPPNAKGLGNLIPYIPDDALKAIKQEYGNSVGPLPVSSGGQLMVTAQDAYVRGLAVHKPWISDALTYEGLSPEQKRALREAKRWYEEHNIRVPLTNLIPPEGGMAIEVPTIVGSNIGAEIPIAFTVRGSNQVKMFKTLLDTGGVLNGQILYHYVGTTRPWKLLVQADLSKVHSYISEHLSAGYYWARADIYRAVERMEQQNIIKITVYDENDNVTGKYKPDKIFDTILSRILDKAFNFYPDIKPEKQQAQAEGRRWWWWNGSYQRRSSTVDISEIINIKITIHGKSEPIPVSIGFFLRVPSYAECEDTNLVEGARTEILRKLYEGSDEEILTLVGKLSPAWEAVGKDTKNTKR
jgi:hypothetical protein